MADDPYIDKRSLVCRAEQRNWKLFYLRLCFLSCGILFVAFLWIKGSRSMNTLPAQTVKVPNVTARVSTISQPICGEWRISSGIGPNDDNFQLTAITVVSSKDVWVAGNPVISPLPNASYMAHWDGSNWSLTPLPDAKVSSIAITSMEAFGKDDIWAIGSSIDPQSNLSESFTMHWDGTAWSVIPSPNPGNWRTSLRGIAGTSSNDVWAVGEYIDNSHTVQPLLLHWDGKLWQQSRDIPFPTGSMNTKGGDGTLDAVAALSSTDVWVVGSTVRDRIGNTRAVTLHWDGSTWMNVPVPGSDEYEGIKAITAISANDVWAIGGRLTMHWDGAGWQSVPNPYLNGSFHAHLYRVAGISSRDVWAVGGYDGAGPIVIHWDGKSWSAVSVPNSMSNQALYDVTRAFTNEVWAVGGTTTASEETEGGPWHSVIMHFVGTVCPTQDK